MNGKKICGILTEALTDFESGGIESIILGIGINFSTAVSSFPENIQQKVDSLFHEKPAGITRNQIAAAVNHVLCLCNQLQDRSFIAEYKARSIVLGKDIEVIQGTNSEKATAIDIDENGGLMIEKQDGTITSLHSGEISIRGNFAS